MKVDRGLMGELPFAAVGIGSPAVVLAGLSPTTGIDGDWFVRASLASFRALAGAHRVYLLNRRAQLPRGITMANSLLNTPTRSPRNSANRST